MSFVGASHGKMADISEDILTSLLIKADVFFAYCQILTRFIQDLLININVTMVVVPLINLISRMIFKLSKTTRQSLLMHIKDY